MCMSRLHQVIGPADGECVRVQGLDGRRLVVSLLAYEGPPPAMGDWLVAQSGFALAPADPEDAAGALSELQGTDDERARP